MKGAFHRMVFLARFISGVVLAPCMCAHDSGTNYFHRVGQNTFFSDQRGFGHQGNKLNDDRRPKELARKKNWFVANATLPVLEAEACAPGRWPRLASSVDSRDLLPALIAEICSQR